MLEGYNDRVASLQSAMLNELEKLSAGKSSADGTAHTATQAADMILEYESALKTIEVCLNNGHRGLRVTWAKSNALDTCDSLEIVQNEVTQGNELERTQVVDELELLLRSVDWLFEYKRRVRTAIKDSHRKIAEQQDLKRDESIEHNAVQYEKQSAQPHPEAYEAKPSGTTKDKLLSRTKQLSANLIRGNQVLQSAVLQSDLNFDELQEQSSSLSKINDKYTQLDTVFVRTSQLVKTLEKASHQERRDVYLALGFLCACVSWVLWRRIFRLPVRLALWLTFRFFKGILMTIGLVKKASPTKMMAPPVSVLWTATTSTASAIGTPSATDTIEQAVDEAINRIFTHDEL